jgi:membrane protease YdiL (CAAX protease family)
LTSVVFAALHFQTGAFRTMNPMKAVYALVVFLASLVFGTVFSQIGLLAAIVTHAVADILALTALRSMRT